MKKLPTEVFCKIFHLVHPDDHTECMLVCHQWNQIMKEFILFHTICLRSPDDLTHLLEKIQRKPTIAKKIERLALVSFECFYIIEREALFRVLTNLKMVHCDDNLRLYIHGEHTKYLWNEMLYSDDSLALFNYGKYMEYPWHKTVRQITGFGFSAIVSQRLSYLTYPKLTTLQIGYCQKNIIPLLKNAPALGYLTLVENNTFTYQDLDEMHSNLPCLKSFSIEFHNISDDSKLDYDIEPATSVTEFIFKHHKYPDTLPKTNILKYAIKKYPNLTKLNFLMDFTNITDNDVDDFNKNEWIPLIQKLGPQLEKLTMYNAKELTNFSGSLDQHYCRIKYLNLISLPLTMLQRLSQSQQARFVQILRLGKYNFESFHWLREFQVLKKLILQGCGDAGSSTIKMNELVRNCPQSLSSLIISGAFVTVDSEYDGPSVNIESLSFHMCEILVHIDTYINSHIPRLSKLKFNCCSLLQNMLNLPAIDLSSFYFEARFSQKEPCLLVLTTGDNKRAWYFPRGMESWERRSNSLEAFHSKRYFRPTTKPENEADIRPKYTLICKSLKNAFITR